MVQCVAVCCSVLQCVAVRCSVLSVIPPVQYHRPLANHTVLRLHAQIKQECAHESEGHSYITYECIKLYMNESWRKLCDMSISMSESCPV